MESDVCAEQDDMESDVCVEQNDDLIPDVCKEQDV